MRQPPSLSIVSMAISIHPEWDIELIRAFALHPDIWPRIADSNVDPDDWVESDMLEELYSIANTNDADMVICDYYIEDGNTRTYKKQMPTSMKPRIVLGDLSGKLHGSCWNKLQ